jgi:hypothetical protein
MDMRAIQGLDIVDPERVQVELQYRDAPRNLKVLYVHVDGITVLRVRLEANALIDFRVPQHEIVRRTKG